MADEEDVGPRLPVPAEDGGGAAPQSRKKRRVVENAPELLNALPSAALYERSYMHRDQLLQVVVTRTEFVITTSVDGHLQFWKKQKEGIEFVKHFRGHLDAITWIDASDDGLLLATVGRDQYFKVYDVINFDMINMVKLPYRPRLCSWIFQRGAAQATLAVTNDETSDIFIYDGRSPADVPIATVAVHAAPVVALKYNEVYDTVVSADARGMVEYWDATTHEHPASVAFELKSDTDLYEFAKNKTAPTAFAISPDGQLMASMGLDRQVRIFKFATGKLFRKYDESLVVLSEMQQAGTSSLKLDDMEFGRRLAIEREIEKSDLKSRITTVFDASGNFVLYATLLGVKVVNVHTNQVVRVIGKSENTTRFMHLALFQGAPKAKGLLTLEMATSDNPAFQEPLEADPTLFATAYKRNRFYLLSRREPSDDADTQALGASGRDVFNEKPTREEMAVATSTTEKHQLGSLAILHTTLGDITVKLFPEYAPMSVENFATHARNGYYNNHIFHRVISGFMIQTGDPNGDGTGGTSIWGNEFKDEFHHNLRHDRPYTLSMANAGPNTNGSQFFITVVPTPWLDNKHTIFGRCISGMDVVHVIEKVRVDKTDKPLEDIKLLSIEIR